MKLAMVNAKRTLRVCSNGHQYYKSSDCPVCPVCEQVNQAKEGFLSIISAPAKRALEHEGILSLQKLASFSEKEILKLHGMGPSTIPKLRKALQGEGLSFKVD
ncbi:MAG TPA: RNA polymerase alpha subunit C-terminal domain-containing protein [Pseudosphingobacterium sp.]|nr:RNA polymerase alpha subunit C-terminal domain-containing protein [Pseudosphingobacterium sp.]